VDNGSREEETLRYIEEVQDLPAVRVLAYDRPFNYSAINNFAVSHSDSEYVLFLNNDTEVISPEWIEAMLEHAQREEIGGVGALLYYPDDTVQHAGVILGLGGIAGHSHSRVSRESFGYFGRLKVVHDLSAVTAACMLTRRSIFDQVGGFDESVTHAFNDVDLCLKIREKGYRIVYTPYAELYHHESLSRGYEDTPEKQARFQREIDYIYERWKTILEAGDPYYNPNLTLKNSGWTVE
jgi:GT2 family glycosyltransferase